MVDTRQRRDDAMRGALRGILETATPADPAATALDMALDGAFAALGLSETQRRHAVEGRGRDVTIGRQGPAAIAEALSHGDMARALEMALRGAHRMGEGHWIWVQDVYDDAVVYRYETPAKTTLYRRTYTISDNGAAITLGDPVEVTQRTEYEPVAEAPRQAPKPAPRRKAVPRAPKGSRLVSLREASGETLADMIAAGRRARGGGR